MSENSHIDKIFKDGLEEMKFSNVDAAWQKMEAELGDAGERRKRRLIITAVLSVLLLTAGFLFVNNIDTTKEIAEDKRTKQELALNSFADKNVNDNGVNEKQVSQSNISVASEKSTSQQTINNVSDNANSFADANEISVFKKHNRSLSGPGSKSFLITNAMEEEVALIETADAESKQGILLEPIFTHPELFSHTSEKSTKPILKFAMPLVDTKPLAEKKEIVNKQDKYTIELIGGTDILRMNRKAGYYTGVRLSKILDKAKGTSVSLGLNYTNNTVKDNYRRATKPAEQPRADFKILDMSMLRMPIYIHQQMASSKFSLMAGLVPSYVVNANIYNVPNSFNPNPEDYRKFGIKDINRFNILFGAGIKYAPLSRVAVEISGSYGFTGLVKDSYRNQSRVLDNFKSIQAGVVLKLK